MAGPARRTLAMGQMFARPWRVLPGARHVILHGCGHVPMYDDPEQVARVLLEASEDG